MGLDYSPVHRPEQIAYGPMVSLFYVQKRRQLRVAVLSSCNALTLALAARRAHCRDALKAALEQVEAFGVGQAVAPAMDAVGEVSRYLGRMAPWRAAKTNPVRAATILYQAGGGVG